MPEEYFISSLLTFNQHFYISPTSSQKSFLTRENHRQPDTYAVISKVGGKWVDLEWPETIFCMWWKKWEVYGKAMWWSSSFYRHTFWPVSLFPVSCPYLRANCIFHCGKTLLFFKQKFYISFNFQLIHQNKAGSERGKVTNCLHLFNLKHYS